MGILNLTPDSFSGDGIYKDVGCAMEKAEVLVAEGADMIDIGGESTRPGSLAVSEEEEILGLDISEHQEEAYSGFQIFTVE